MNLNHVYSQVFKAVLSVRKNTFRLFDVTIWALTFFLSLTLLASFASGTQNLVGFVVVAAMGWRVLYHFSFEPAHLYVEEYWDDSSDHLLFSPLSLSEMVFAGAVVAFIKLVIVAIVFLLASVLFLGVVPDFLVGLGAFAFLAVYGLIICVIFLGISFAYGSTSFALVYAVADVIAIFSGVFYPLSMFPDWLRGFALLFPSTYGFALIKNAFGINEVVDPVLAFASLFAWFALALLANKFLWEKARKEGKLLKLK